MKYFLTILTLAAAVLASPSGPPPPPGPPGPPGPPHPPPPPPPPPPACRPGTYACLPNLSGWQVCNTQGQFVFAGNCPPATICKFFVPSQSPYCVPPNFQFP